MQAACTALRNIIHNKTIAPWEHHSEVERKDRTFGSAESNYFV